MSSNSSHNDGVPTLNNYLQSINKAEFLSWHDTKSGLAHSPQWESICKIDNVAMGRGSGPQKHIARDIAAKEALNALRATK